MARSAWWRHGILNTLEHAVTRGADAVVTLVIISVLRPETFGALALAQAWIAPVLLVFVAPELVLYRDFGKWKSASSAEIAHRMSAYRAFAWLKAAAAGVFCVIIATLVPFGEGWNERFLALAWGFLLVLTPQISSPDREFLRLDLKLKQLNWVTLVQKLTLLGGVIWAAQGSAPLGRLVIAGGLALFLTCGLAWLFFRAALAEASDQRAPAKLESYPAIWAESLREFSIWSHLQGVAHGWVTTLDLWFLGLVGAPARTLGLYGTVLKLSSLAMALPLALSNLFGLWLGRQAYPDALREEVEVRRLSWRLGAVSFGGALIIALAAPWILDLLSRGRWAEAEQRQMLRWLWLIIGGAAMIASTFLLTSWLAVRAPIKRLFVQVYLTWAAISVALYAGAAQAFGANGVAWTNLLVAAVFVGFLARFRRSYLRRRRGSGDAVEGASA